MIEPILGTFICLLACLLCAEFTRYLWRCSRTTVYLLAIILTLLGGNNWGAYQLRKLENKINLIQKTLDKQNGFKN